ncbi:MAG: hypothetical protein K0S22_1351 [Oscillospiraceae bacterium]|jgi:hypothetical protein|nr:hypothetical protein [Oscillospiraceae bacterium]
MYLPAISAAYWRTVKRGGRTFESIPAELKESVTTLAKTDVVNGVITAENYLGYIGATYEA